MSEVMEEEIKRWTVRESALGLEIIQGKTMVLAQSGIPGTLGMRWELPRTHNPPRRMAEFLTR